jgi:hypothetical protein
MKRVFHILVIAIIVISCKEENLSPTAFIEYSQPYAENMDESLLTQLDEVIKQGVFGDIHSLIIFKKWQLGF